MLENAQTLIFKRQEIELFTFVRYQLREVSMYIAFGRKLYVSNQMTGTLHLVIIQGERVNRDSGCHASFGAL